MENIQFVNQCEIEKEQFNKQIKFASRRLGIEPLWFTVLRIICTVIMAGFLLGYVFLVRNSVILLCGVLFAIGVLVFCEVKRLTYVNTIYKSEIKNCEGGRWTSTKRFGEKIELQQSNNITVTYKYSQIRLIEEDEDCFLLYIGIETIMYVYKKGFTAGNADDFRNFIYAKLNTGTPDEKITLWSEREFKNKVRKKNLPKKIVMSAILIGAVLWLVGVILWLAHPGFSYDEDFFTADSLPSILYSYEEDGFTLIATKELDGGIVIFFY
ncbi:MAG: YcxB family protein [Oscillospiraceae bacterium]|jgi:RsiW-degrading membrane proteinase PrsW (M82 family)|nr:YcxB family protein [Oscillospiraceae bacterium]